MNRIKQSRAASFIAVGAVYLLATVCGMLVFRWTPGGPSVKLLAADVAATLLTFVCSLVFGNASVYDPYWSVQPPVILLALMGGGR